MPRSDEFRPVVIAASISKGGGGEGGVVFELEYVVSLRMLGTGITLAVP